MYPHLSRGLGQLNVAFAYPREILLGQLLQVEQGILRALDGADDLVELELHRHAVAVLGVLDDEHHQEGDDRRAGVDDELPGIGKAEERSARGPQYDDEAGSRESEGMTGRARHPRSKLPELAFVIHDAPSLCCWCDGPRLRAFTFGL